LKKLLIEQVFVAAGRIGRFLVKDSKEKGEILRNAIRLLKTKGDGALGYAEKMVEKTQESGNEKDLAFWKRIVSQVELLNHEPPPE